MAFKHQNTQEEKCLQREVRDYGALVPAAFQVQALFSVGGT